MQARHRLPAFRFALAVVCLGCSQVDVELLDAGLQALDASTAAQCRGDVCACVNGLDDDGDGRIDGIDDGCTGGRDDDEATFGLEPLRGAECLDCFFDANEGSGDDQCRVSGGCWDGAATAGACPSCDAADACRGNCLPLVPNGCDCFGCCGVESAGVTRTVIFAEGCALAALGDATLCPPCTQNAMCLNPCERCERCPGRPEPPPDCAPTCVGGTLCDEATPCAAGRACVLGCCLAVPG